MPTPDLIRNLIFRGLRLAFRATPLTGATRLRLREHFVRRHARLVPVPRGMAPAGAGLSQRLFDHAAHRSLAFRARTGATLPPSLPARVVAFYLPQFHPIPENDRWWGAGFTEWRNVGRALPQFEGQVQPRVPADLGYYDLRLSEVMREQMVLAREYGIAAFCTYFYWFAGKTLLERPLRQWLDDPSLDLPICLCWANENWSRRWDGKEQDVLIGQQHSPEDDIAFIEYVSIYLRDPRYLRVEGKPMLLVYRPGLLTDPAATAERWRSWCRENGVGEVHIACVQSFDTIAPASIGFDSAVAFPPANAGLTPVTSEFRLINKAFQGQIYDWRELKARSMAAADPEYRLYPCINPGWDNEARRSGRGLSFVRATPRAFSAWARAAISTACRRVPEAPLVFVNAWNEWAEGAILEPDTRYGFAWLDAIRKAFAPVPAPPSRPCAVIHVWYPELLEEIVLALRATELPFRIVLTVPHEREKAVREEAAHLQLDAEIVVTANRGRDILPFLQVAGRLLDEGEDIVLKLHTKRSTHRRNGAAWRKELLTRLLSPRRAKVVLDAFRADPTLGLVAPEGHVQPLSSFQGMNADNVHYLCALTGIAPPEKGSDPFVAGSMFWCRLPALAGLIDSPLCDADFEPEDGQTDGTMAHAIERVALLSARSAGYSDTTAGRLVGEPDIVETYNYADEG